MLQNSRWFKVGALIAMLVLSQLSFAQGGSSTIKEKPSAGAMAADLLMVRPVMLGVTVIGSALWLVSLPFSALGGNALSAADTLVVGPAEATFIRCLGCTGDGYDASGMNQP